VRVPEIMTPVHHALIAGTPTPDGQLVGVDGWNVID